MPLAGANLAVSSSRRPRAPLNDAGLVIRTATAVIGIPVVIAIAIVGGSIFALAVIVVSLAAAWEAYRMVKSRGHRPALLFVLAMSALLATAPASSNPRLWWQATVVVGLLATGLWVLASGAGPEAFLDLPITAAIAVYTGGLLGYLTAIRLLDHGLQLVLLVLVLNWAYDTGAYFTGRSIGRTPFMAHISEKKTWEGVGGGLALTVVAAVIAAIPLGVHVGVAVLLGVVVASAAQVGDLIESLMKRYSGVKDSGAIIPGHGGLLDRIDSLLFSGAAAYYLLLATGYHG